MPEIILPELVDERPEPEGPYNPITGETRDQWRERKLQEQAEVAAKLDLAPNSRHKIQKLSARHRIMLNYFLAGESQKDIAARFNMTVVGVNIIYNSPFFQQALRERQQEIADGLDQNTFNTVSEAKQLIEEEAFRAAEKLVLLSRSQDDKIAFQATKNLLDRALGSEKPENERVGFSLSNAQIQNLQIVLQQSKKTA